ncbi:MAG: hypothetical protein D3904_10895 [Candidatus Electrothrix sp. EH2]|nr:hypothetical protein [Candidatus Electrothrix sp. EH2]
MAMISKSLLLFLFQGALYWTCIQPEKIEPYFVSFAVLFILFVVYAGSCGSVPDLQVKRLKFKKIIPDSMPTLCYEIENIGDGEARNIHIETRINMTIKKKAVSPFLFKFLPEFHGRFYLTAELCTKSFRFSEG